MSDGGEPISFRDAFSSDPSPAFHPGESQESTEDNTTNAKKSTASPGRKKTPKDYDEDEFDEDSSDEHRDDAESAKPAMANSTRLGLTIDVGFDQSTNQIPPGKSEADKVVDQALASGVWKKEFDSRSKKHYYYNVLTNKTTWNLAELLAPAPSSATETGSTHSSASTPRDLLSQHERNEEKKKKQESSSGGMPANKEGTNEAGKKPAMLGIKRKPVTASSSGGGQSTSTKEPVKDEPSKIDVSNIDTRHSGVATDDDDEDPDAAAKLEKWGQMSGLPRSERGPVLGSFRAFETESDVPSSDGGAAARAMMMTEDDSKSNQPGKPSGGLELEVLTTPANPPASDATLKEKKAPVAISAVPEPLELEGTLEGSVTEKPEGEDEKRSSEDDLPSPNTQRRRAGINPSSAAAAAMAARKTAPKDDTSSDFSTASQHAAKVREEQEKAKAQRIAEEKAKAMAELVRAATPASGQAQSASPLLTQQQQPSAQQQQRPDGLTPPVVASPTGPSLAATALQGAPIGPKPNQVPSQSPVLPLQSPAYLSNASFPVQKIAAQLPHPSAIHGGGQQQQQSPFLQQQSSFSPMMTQLPSQQQLQQPMIMQTQPPQQPTPADAPEAVRSTRVGDSVKDNAEALESLIRAYTQLKAPTSMALDEGERQRNNRRKDAALERQTISLAIRDALGRGVEERDDPAAPSWMGTTAAVGGSASTSRAKVDMLVQKGKDRHRLVSTRGARDFVDRGVTERVPPRGRNQPATKHGENQQNKHFDPLVDASDIETDDDNADGPATQQMDRIANQEALLEQEMLSMVLGLVVQECCGQSAASDTRHTAATSDPSAAQVLGALNPKAAEAMKKSTQAAQEAEFLSVQAPTDFLASNATREFDEEGILTELVTGGLEKYVISPVKKLFESTKEQQQTRYSRQHYLAALTRVALIDATRCVQQTARFLSQQQQRGEAHDFRPRCVIRYQGPPKDAALRALCSKLLHCLPFEILTDTDSFAFRLECWVSLNHIWEVLEALNAAQRKLEMLPWDAYAVFFQRNRRPSSSSATKSEAKPKKRGATRRRVAERVDGTVASGTDTDGGEQHEEEADFLLPEESILKLHVVQSARQTSFAKRPAATTAAPATTTGDQQLRAQASQVALSRFLQDEDSAERLSFLASKLCDDVSTSNDVLRQLLLKQDARRAGESIAPTTRGEERRVLLETAVVDTLDEFVADEDIRGSIVRRAGKKAEETLTRLEDEDEAGGGLLLKAAQSKVNRLVERLRYEMEMDDH